jgi:hypothetical protein
MALFVEVKSLEKNCPVIINLDEVMEIAPLVGGGCALFTVSNGIIKVGDGYEQFKQFAMQTISSDDVAKRVAKLPEVQKEPAPVADIVSPTKTTKGKGIVDDLKIPTMGSK